MAKSHVVKCFEEWSLGEHQWRFDTQNGVLVQKLWQSLWGQLAFQDPGISVLLVSGGGVWTVSSLNQRGEGKALMPSKGHIPFSCSCCAFNPSGCSSKGKPVGLG